MLSSLVSLLFFGGAYANSMYHQSHPSPEGFHHGKSSAYYHSIRSQPADSLKDRFLEQYKKVMDSSSGYFSKDGVPYHSVETLMVEAPDYGHETTSEAFSEYIWMTAMNIWATNGDTTDFKAAWAKLEDTLIPKASDQPTNQYYNPSTPASYAPEEDTPSKYPVTIDRGVSVGQDDLDGELKAVYGNTRFFATHWLMDVDNIYGFGKHESGNTQERNVFLNSYQRGPNESVWRTVPQPEWDIFKYGEQSPNHCGFLEIFIYDPEYACDAQWRYTGAPDADARTIQATYWAYVFTNNGNGINQEISWATQLSDYVRYSMFDKYFKIVPCYSTNCPAVTFQNGWNATFYLISWYMAWGGPINDNYWGFRIGASHVHQGYQNALSAYVLSTIPAFQSKTTGGKGHWEGAYWQTLKFWNWLQSVEGGIAGGATNSWGGQYKDPSKDGITGYFLNGMAYIWDPVYDCPPSNNWFGMQAWSQERNAEVYYVTGNGLSKTVMDKWVSWVLGMKSQIIIGNNDFQVPSNLKWTGQPSNYTGDAHTNTNLHVAVSDWSKDVGVASALAHALTFYAAKSGNADAQTLARDLLDRLYMYADNIGIGINESRQDYIGNEYGLGFWEPVYVPEKLPNGESLTFGNYPQSSNGGQGGSIKHGDTFIDLRPWYKNDPMWPTVEQAKNSGKAPVFVYHRLWAQAEYAIACADYARLFGSNSTNVDNDLYFAKPIQY